MSDLSVISWLRLARLPGVGPVLIKRLLDVLGSPEAILAAHPATLAGVEGIGSIRANQIVSHAAQTEKPAIEEFQKTRDRGITLLPQCDAAYPPALKTITDPPLLLYVRGKLLPADAVAVGIVGVRECTLYGREQAKRFGHDLAQAGFTVISGARVESIQPRTKARCGVRAARL